MQAIPRAALLWPAILAFVLLSLGMAVQWLIAQDINQSLFALVSPGNLLIALGMQLVALCILTLAWHVNVRSHGLVSVSFYQSTLMVGINAIGKYSPGKIGGVLARGAALYRVTGNRKIAVQTTFVEQLAMFHGGFIIMLITWLAQREYWLMLAAAIALSIVSVWGVATAEDVILRLYHRIRPAADVATLAEDRRFYRSYLLVFALLYLVWLTSAATLYFCIHAYVDTASFSFSDAIQINTMAYLAGFLAFFSLAGLGAREGVLVALLSGIISLPAAVSVSVMLRLITLLPDLVLGALSLLCGKHGLTDHGANGEKDLV